MGEPVALYGSMERKDYLRQVSRVIGAAGEVEEGTYRAGALAGLTERGDELGRLARVFDSMAAGIRAREA